MGTGNQDSGPVDFSSLGGNPTSAVTPAAAAAPVPAQPDATSGPVNFSSLGGRPVNADVSAGAIATQTGGASGSQATPEQPWYVQALNKVGEVGGKAFFGDNTAAAAPLSPTQSSEMSGLADIAQGNFRQGLSKIKHAEAIHVVAGSPIEKLIQKFKPDFVGGVTPSQAEAEDRQNKAGLESPAVDAAQFIDKDKHPVLKALTEAAQSMTSPTNVAVMISTGGVGMVESPKALGVANRLISAGFTAQAVGQAYKNLKEFKTAYDKGDANEALYQLTHAVTSGTMAYLAGSHAVGDPALEGAGKEAAAAVHGAADTIKGALDERAAAKANKVSGEDLIAANKDFKKAVPPTKTYPYSDNDLIVANNYLEPQHMAEPIRGVQHTVDALDNSIEGIENKVSDHVKIIPNEPIGTNVLDDVQAALEQNERGDEFVKAGMKEIEGLDLADMNMARADNVRRQLNAENQAILKKNNYDLAAARAGDPGFAAREAAAESLRNGIYNQLEAHGIEGVRELRQEEGSLLKVRNAAQAQVFNGDKVIKGTGGAGLGRRLAGRGAVAAGTALGAGTGAAVGGVPGAIIGGGVGAELGSVAKEAIVPPDLTHNEVLERRFRDKQVATGQPGGVTVNLHAPAPPDIPAGTQQEIPPPIPKATPGIPEQPNLFGTTNTEASQQSPQVERQLLQQRIRPLQAILESPTATAAEKIEAARQIAKLGLGQFANPEVPQANASPGEVATAAKAKLNPTEATGERALGSKTTLETAQPEKDWVPPAGLEKGIPRDEAVSTEIPLSKISVSEGAYNGAASNISRKAPSKTSGPVSLVYNPDNGQYLVEDGMHRLVQAHQEGKTTIPAKIWSGYSDIANVPSGSKMDLSPIEEEQEHAEGYIHPDTLTESAREIPSSARPTGTTSQQVHEHEIGGHLANAAVEGFTVDHIIGNDHPTAGRRTVAAAVINWDGIDVGPDGNMTKQSVRDNIHRIMSVTMGGGVQDALNGLPFTENKGLSGDLRFAKRIAEYAGLTPEETNEVIKAGVERARKNLTQPGMQDTIKSNAAVREAKLEPGLHVSPERTQGLVNEFRRIHEQNGNTIGEVHGEAGSKTVQGNGPRDAAEGPGSRPVDDTGREGRAAGQPLEVRQGLRERTAGDSKVDDAIRTAGAIPAGDMMNLAPFHDPETGSTLAFDKRDITPELVQKHLDESREKFGIGKAALATEEEAEPEIAEKAIDDSKKSGGGFIADMRTGKPTDTGFLVEVAPDKRILLGHPATPKDLQKFYNDNRQLFKQHPELRIGGYKNELNISAHTDSQQTAEQLARKLDQKSVWDVKKGEEIPTGGQGKQVKFADYPFEQRIKELRGHSE